MCHVTSDAMKIEPKAVVKHYCVWFDFYCIRRYFSTTTTTAFKVNTQEAQNLHQLKSPLADPNLFSKSTSKCEHCETRKTVFEKFINGGLKGRFSIDADAGPRRS